MASTFGSKQNTTYKLYQMSRRDFFDEFPQAKPTNTHFISSLIAMLACPSGSQKKGLTSPSVKNCQKLYRRSGK